ncbi:hypothetical protein Nepgr_009780 [Nepenthes gracilis]|uniref:Dof zinc finger protein n=1 Tax=Nepenthes gracilis TaxID=150966 RepID=A0AAD3SB43_NEPGR|nr:hypothetical protein Nepgr_009780 [Nepenthes gracilis]
MVFSSVPVYLDPPNWQQQANHQAAIATDSPGLIPAPLSGAAGSSCIQGASGVFRPASLFDRSQLAKLPLPEAGLECPRCESTNTKFCYFNNYNLSQPRHFCKTCRRYWTRGGALRNVPFGGRRRRNNKRNKGTQLKSLVTEGRRGGMISTSNCTASCSSTRTINAHLTSPSPNHLLFLLGNYEGFALQPSASGGNAVVLEHQTCGRSSGHGAITSAGIGQQPPRFPAAQQFPCLSGLEPLSLQPPENEQYEFQHSDRSLEAQNEGLSLSKILLGINGTDQCNWSSGNAWSYLL